MFTWHEPGGGKGNINNKKETERELTWQIKYKQQKGKPSGRQK